MDAYHCKNKAEILLEIGSLGKAKDDDKKDLVFFYIFRYSNELLGTEESKIQWHGKVRAVNDKVDILDKTVVRQDAQIKTHINTENEDLKTYVQSEINVFKKKLEISK